MAERALITELINKLRYCHSVFYATHSGTQYSCVKTQQLIADDSGAVYR